MKKFIAAILSLALFVVSCPLFSSAATGYDEVILDSSSAQSGNVYNNLADALSSVNNNGTIKIVGTYAIPYGFSWATHNKAVTLTGGTLDATALSVNLILGDDTTFDNITLVFEEKDNIIAGGHKLVITQSVVMDSTKPINVFGGGRAGSTVASTDITILAGTYYGIYGGSFQGTVSGNTNVYVGGNTNSSIDEKSHSSTHLIFGAGNADTVLGSTNLTLADNAKANYVFGGGLNSCTVSNVNFNITGGNCMSIYGGNRTADLTGNINLTMTGGQFQQVFGGNEAGMVTGSVNAKILGGKITRRLYGGCYNGTTDSLIPSFKTDYHVSGSIKLILGGNVSITFDEIDPAENSKYNDRSIYARSRRKSASGESSTLIFANANTYNSYKDKLCAQDTAMSFIIGSISAADNIHYYTHTGSGATLTEKCAYHSNYSATATLSVDNSKSLAYCGTPIEAATVNYSNGYEGEPLEITYQNNITPGTATATITGNGGSASINYTINKANQSAPSGLTVENETIRGKADGKILGLTTEMEISTDNVAFTEITNTDRVFETGTYYVRNKGNDFYLPSPAVTLTIAEGRMLKVTFEIEGQADVVKEVEWNGTITDIPEIPEKEGYTKDAPYWSIDTFTNIQKDFTTTAIYLIDGYTVNFIGAGNKALGSIRIAEGKTFADYANEISVINQKIPSIYGYELFTDEETGVPLWSVDVYSEDTPIYANMVVSAQYLRNKSITSQVTAYDTANQIIVNDTFVYDQRITLVDETANTWLVSGVISSVGSEAIFYACGEKMTITASTLTSTKPAVSILSKINDSGNFMVFARVDCPDGSKVVKYGIIFSSNTYMNKYRAASDKGALFTLDDWEAFNKAKPSLQKSEGSIAPIENINFVCTLSNVARGVTRHARAYAILDNGEVIYSDIIINNLTNGFVSLGSAKDDMEE